MLCLGIGIFLYLSFVHVGMDTFASVGFVGTVSAAVGAGLLTSGYVSLKLSRRMGLINGNAHVPATGEIARSA